MRFILSERNSTSCFHLEVSHYYYFFFLMPLTTFWVMALQTQIFLGIFHQVYMCLKYKEQVFIIKPKVH